MAFVRTYRKGTLIKGNGRHPGDKPATPAKAPALSSVPKRCSFETMPVTRVPQRAPMSTKEARNQRSGTLKQRLDEHRRNEDLSKIVENRGTQAQSTTVDVGGVVREKKLVYTKPPRMDDARANRLVNRMKPQPETGLDLHITHLITFLEDKGRLETPGLYRVSGPAGVVDTLVKQCKNKDPLQLNEKLDVHAASGVLKRIFQLPYDGNSTLIPQEIQTKMVEYASMSDEDFEKQFPGKSKVDVLLEHLKTNLPRKNKAAFELILKHLGRVARHSADNLMNPENLAIVFGPNLYTKVTISDPLKQLQVNPTFKDLMRKLIEERA